MLLFDCHDCPLQGNTGDKRASPTLELSWADKFAILIIAFDIDDGIATFLERPFLQGFNGREERPLAGSFIRLIKRVGFFVGSKFRHFFRNPRMALTGEIDLYIIEEHSLLEALLERFLDLPILAVITCMGRLY